MTRLDEERIQEYDHGRIVEAVVTVVLSEAALDYDWGGDAQKMIDRHFTEFDSWRSKNKHFRFPYLLHR